MHTTHQPVQPKTVLSRTTQEHTLASTDREAKPKQKSFKIARSSLPVEKKLSYGKKEGKPKMFRRKFFEIYI